MKIKDRKEAVDIIQKQLKNFNNDTIFTHRHKDTHYRYGRQELRELIDLIYGEPTNPDEKIK